MFLASMLSELVPLKPRKKLRFFVTGDNLPGGFELYWKVLNRGYEAQKRDMIRGQLHSDEGRRERRESTSFKGEHVVEAYAVLNGVVVARDAILVPIDSNQEDT